MGFYVPKEFRGMGVVNNKPCCDGRENCQKPITRIDQKGFIYCDDHKPTTRKSRKLTPSELKKINNNQKLERY